jgi:ABC-type bacteriocin/lantibiotic exporter with double-glycine peptidase domain
MQILYKLLKLLTLREQKKAGLLIIMILISAIFEALGIATILPFVAVLSNPDIIDTNIILNTFFNVSKSYGVTKKIDFLLVLGIVVFVFLIVSIVLRAYMAYLQTKFSYMWECNICKRLLTVYLHQSYSWFLSKNSADISKNILSETHQLVINGLSPLIDLFAKSFTVITILILLIIIDSKLTFIIGIALSAVYIFVFILVHKVLKKIGKKRLLNNELRFKTILEAFGAIKQIKLSWKEENYLQKFSNSAKDYAGAHTLAVIIAQLPRFLLEGIAFGGVLLIIIYSLAKVNNFNSLLPIISLFIFAGYRLMPSVHQIYVSVTKLVYASSSINKLYDDLKNLATFDKTNNRYNLDFSKEINLKNIHYRYPNSERNILININLTIPINTKVGLIGSTGSGKSTIADIIVGLLLAQKGTLDVDGIVIKKNNLRSWQKMIGYVPQHIFLSDDTIAANIAFDAKEENIDNNILIRSAKTAELYSFIMDELPEKFETLVGERGVKLSGGQRQRIGIARALYRKPKILILDEATSALDNETEKRVMNALHNLNHQITIIVISHRLQTIEKCDQVYEITNGKIKIKTN